MRSWLSYRFVATESQEVFLLRGLLPFFEQSIWSTEGQRAFYIRYEDAGGPHLRVRLSGDIARLQSEFEHHMRERGTWTPLPYQPETERFGGEQLLPWAEEHFHLSTRVALERMKRPNRVYGDTMFDAMSSGVMLGYAAKMEREELRDWFTALYDQWLPLFFRTPEGEALPQTALREIEHNFEKSIQQQGADLRDAMNTLWLQLSGDRATADLPDWLRWLRGNELILPNFEGALPLVLPSLMHLHFNRLGINNQDEVFILYLLSNSL